MRMATVGYGLKAQMRHGEQETGSLVRTVGSAAPGGPVNILNSYPEQESWKYPCYNLQCAHCSVQFINVHYSWLNYQLCWKPRLLCASHTGCLQAESVLAWLAACWHRALESSGDRQLHADRGTNRCSDFYNIDHGLKISMLLLELAAAVISQVGCPSWHQSKTATASEALEINAKRKKLFKGNIPFFSLVSYNAALHSKSLTTISIRTSYSYELL